MPKGKGKVKGTNEKIIDDMENLMLCPETIKEQEKEQLPISPKPSNKRKQKGRDKKKAEGGEKVEGGSR